MAAYEVLLLNTAIPQIQAAQSGDTYVVPRDIAFSTVANLANGTNLLPSLTFSSDTNTGIYREGADALGFTAGGGTNQMVLTTTGLGIGTNNPAAKLEVSSSGSSGRILLNGADLPMITNGYDKFTSGSYNGAGRWGLFMEPNALTFGLPANAFATFLWKRFNADSSVSSTSMTLDASGNLGLGVTPSNFAVVKAFQAEYATLAGNSSVNLAVNAYFNSGWKYTAAASALLYTADSGSHKWYRSTSAQVINTDPVFDQAMTLDASGNLGIGTTSIFTNPRLSVYNGATLATGGDGGGNGVLIAAATGSASSGQLVVAGSDTAAIDKGGAIVFAGKWDTATNNIAQWAKIVGYKENATNNNYAGYLGFYTRADGGAATERARITSGGDLLVKKTSSGGSATGIDLNANGFVGSYSPDTSDATVTYAAYSNGASAYRFYVGWGGTVFATNTTISAISDQRFKENIRDLDIGLNAILALKPRKFDWKIGKGKDKKDDRGFIAQEFEQVFPDLIDTWKDPAPEGEEPYKSVRQDLIPVLVKAIQEQQAMINELKAEVAALKGA